MIRFLFPLILMFTILNGNAQDYNVIVDSIQSETLNEQREFWIKLPDNYNPEVETKYPIVYLLDGKSLKNSLITVYNNYWGHFLPNMILVGVSNQYNRTKDLTTVKLETRRGASFSSDSGGAENFTQFLEKELIPHIDKNYKTSKLRTLIGHSYAGLFTINTLLYHQHLFTNYIAIDPSLDWSDQHLLKEAKPILQNENFNEKGLFISLAAEQLHMFNEKITMDNLMKDTTDFTLFARSIVEFSNFAQSQSQNGMNVIFEVYKEDLHGTVPLPSMRDGLVGLFNWFQFKNPPKYNNPETSIDEIQELLNVQEKIYTKHFGVPTPPMIEELLGGYGYMNMDMGNPEKAYLFFSNYIKYYPKSAGAYEGMADYYVRQNNKKEALNYMNKAYELNNSNYYKKRISELQQKE